MSFVNDRVYLSTGYVSLDFTVEDAANVELSILISNPSIGAKVNYHQLE